MEMVAGQIILQEESVAKQPRFGETERAFDRRSDVDYNADDNPHSRGGKHENDSDDDR